MTIAVDGDPTLPPVSWSPNCSDASIVPSWMICTWQNLVVVTPSAHVSGWFTTWM
ncbi:MAG: hypothetical protein M5U18_08475 [Dehalococcoidia bacterium]|nr:hypothetical protein [Dehalococcoidia bacterium]